MLHFSQTLGLLEITKEVAGSSVAVDDLVSSDGFIREAGDSADCREMLKDIERVVHDDDDAGSAEAYDMVCRECQVHFEEGRRGV